MKSGCTVTFDTSDIARFVVRKSDGSERSFVQSKHSLFYLDTNLSKKKVVLVNTVEDNRARYTKRAYLQSKLARKI
jgi:hypothetical protein